MDDDESEIEDYSDDEISPEVTDQTMNDPQISHALELSTGRSQSENAGSNNELTRLYHRTSRKGNDGGKRIAENQIYPSVQTIDYMAYITFAILYLAIFVPTLVYVVRGEYVEFRLMEQYKTGLRKSLTLFETIYPTHAYVFESSRLSSTWASSPRATELTNVVNNVQILFAGISNDITTYSSPAPFRSLLQEPYTSISSNAREIVGVVTSSNGLSFLMQDAMRATTILAHSRSLNPIALSPDIENVYNFDTTTFRREFLLGLADLCFMHLEYYAKTSDYHATIGRNIYIGVIFLCIGVFYLLYVHQEKMREDIKQNCLCALVFFPNACDRVNFLTGNLFSVINDSSRHH
jgi:hypothetical protein